MAHSMGGLVARGAVMSATGVAKEKTRHLITLSTPWLGHEAARLGVEWSPTVAPVWYSMVPNSAYQQEIFAGPLPSHLKHHLYFSFSHKTHGPSTADDGVVTVKSQLGQQAQAEAAEVRGIDDNHNGILSNRCVADWVEAVLVGEERGQPGAAVSSRAPQC